MTTPTNTLNVQPLVSVAMITYNQRPYLEKAVECVMAQSVDFTMEVLLGEDHSTDGTRELAIELQRRFPERLRLITSDANVGAIKNLERVERACRGRYVAYCEGDDYWNDSTKLAKQIAFIEAGSDYSMVHSHCDRYFMANRRLVRNSLRVPQGLDDANGYEDILTGRRSPLTVTIMARREALHWVLDHCPECTDPCWPMGDTQRWLELARRGKVGCIHEPLVTTNVLLESAGQSQNPDKRLRFYLAARDLKLHYLRKYPVDSEIDRTVRHDLAWSLLQEAYHARDSAVADDMFANLIQNGGRNGLTARWLRWGSQSPLRHRLVYPYLKTEARWRRLKWRLGLRASSKNITRLW